MAAIAVVEFHNWDYDFFWNSGTVFGMSNACASRILPSGSAA
jgi:hypothetical protein